MEKFTRTTTVENQRAAGDPLVNDARHFASVLTKKALTVDALGSEEAPLRREGDNRDEMVAAVRKEYARAANFTVTEKPDEIVEEPLAPANESVEKLSDIEKACLEAIRTDFNRGIVLIDDNADKDAYQKALKSDKTAGKSWEAIQVRLLANKAALLKKSVELSKLTGNTEGKGALLVGVYENGELAIRQRSQEIVNARWTKRWKDGESDKGELRLLYHADAVAQEAGRWAKAVEILRAVKSVGYHVPADANRKEGLVAASEAVTGTHYVMSSDGKEWRDAMLECSDNIADSTAVRVVNFDPYDRDTRVAYDVRAYYLYENRGAVLWLRG